MPTHRITNADVVRSGNAVSANRAVLGVPMSNLVIESFAPALAAAAAAAAAQAVGAAGNLVLTGGSMYNATLGVVVFDVPRNVQTVSTNAGDTTQTMTVYGTDVWGAAVVESLTQNGTTPVVGVKAFKTISRIAYSAAAAGNISAGTGAKLGLSYRPVVGGFIRGRFGEDTADAGTYVPPSRVTATATTVDVRGTYAYAGTANGTNVFTVQYIAANGPDNTDAFGVAQFAG